VYRCDYTVNTEVSLLNARHAYQTDDIASSVATRKYESNMSNSSGVYYIMLGVPDFPNLLFGELYQAKGTEGKESIQ